MSRCQSEENAEGFNKIINQTFRKKYECFYNPFRQIIVAKKSVNTETIYVVDNRFTPLQPS